MTTRRTRNRSHRTLRRGLTLPELIIGTAMLGMIGTALTSFTLAMSAGWTNSDRQFKIENAGKRSGDQIEATLSGMLYVAQVKEPTAESPSSHVFYWSKDNLPLKADHKAQLGEMALLEYDSTSKAVRVYRAKTTGLNALQTSTLLNEDWGDPTAPAIVDYFKSLDSVEVTPLIGGGESDILVNDATFKHFTPIGSKPMTTYSMHLSNGNAQDAHSGTVPMRAGRKPKNF